MSILVIRSVYNMAKILLGNLKGPKGDKGDQGPRGPQGIQGPAGTTENIDLTPFVTKTENSTLTGQYTFTNNTPIKLNGYSIVSENNRISFKNANNNVFAFDDNTITHNDKSLLTQDKANTLYAPIGDYVLSTALNSYATKTEVENTYLTKTDAANSYVTQNTLSNKMNTLETDVGSMLQNMVQIKQLNNYVSKDGDNNITGTIHINKPNGLTLPSHSFESTPTNLIIKNNANQPILTIYPSVAYLNGREILSQFKADQLYAPKSALNGYVTMEQYNKDMNSLLTKLEKMNK